MKTRCYFPLAIAAAWLFVVTTAEFTLKDSLFEDETRAIAIAAIAESRALYQSLQETYIQEGCVQQWGEFPTTALSSTASLSLEIPPNSVCKCGLLYDMALTTLGLEPIEEVAEKEQQQQEQLWIQEKSNTEYYHTSDATDTQTNLESFVMASLPHLQAACSGGSANGYPCKNVNLIAHLPLGSFRTPTTGLAPQAANDVWGWTKHDNGVDREFIIWGVAEGHIFLEVTNFEPIVLGFLPSTNAAVSYWHDMKIIGDYCYMGSEAKDHGMQIFDMRKLLDMDPNSDCVDDDKYCTVLSWDRLYRGNNDHPLGNSHNVVANEESGFVYLVGGGCNGGLHIVDVSDPLNPTTAGCFGDDGYVHDAQCVNYKGPDPEFQNSEICVSFNADSVTIVDVTDKSNMKILSKIGYEGVAFTHQGWLSTDHTHVLFGDEIDELQSKGKTRTLVVNIQDLRNPKNVQGYFGTSNVIDHNQYIVKATAKGQDYDSSKFGNTDLIYQANYEAGLRILQVLDYETADFVEVGYFDIHPQSNSPAFNGAWSTYPYFPSGLVAISGTRQGLFLVKPNLQLVAPKVDCSDQTVAYQGYERKNCDWVGKVRTGKPRFTRYRTRKRCKKIHEGKPLYEWCQRTCGAVGLGLCADLDRGLCETYTIQVQTDNYPIDSSCRILDASGTKVFHRGTLEENLTLYQDTVCLKYNTEYRFVMVDSYGDGLCCKYGDGYYKVMDSKGNTIVDREDGPFTVREFPIHPTFS